MTPSSLILSLSNCALITFTMGAFIFEPLEEEVPLGV